MTREVEQVVQAAETFRDATKRETDVWRDKFDELRRKGKTAVLWAASSKTVSFLSAVGNDSIAATVDINPYKQGKFLPGSGQSVVCRSRRYSPRLRSRHEPRL